MRSILEELFYGNICPNTDCRSTDKETKELMGYIADNHDTLLKEPTDKQKEILKKFDDCCEDTTAVEAFDATFPPKEKKWMPSQEEFYIYSHSSVVR